MWKTWAVSHLSESEVDMGPVFSFYAGKESRGEDGGGQFSVSSRKKEEMETVVKNNSM